MPKLYFVHRTESEIAIFGGTVFVDLDGKRVGEVFKSHLIIDVAPGTHIIKMYKSHTYDTFVGFAEVSINVEENKDLTFRYSAPMLVTQPGHIVVADFISLVHIDEQLKRSESMLKQEKQANDLHIQTQNKESEKNNNMLIFWIVVVPIISTLLFFIIQMAYL